MRKRLFWTIAGVAAITGFLVLAASLVASQRAAVVATYREMAQSTSEAAGIIEETVEQASERPRAARELFRLVEGGGQLGPMLSRIRRTAGSSEMAFAARVDGEPVGNAAPLFDRVLLQEDVLAAGDSQFTRSDQGELVVVTPAVIETRGGEVTLLIAMARQAPVVRSADQLRGLVPIAIGIALVAAVAARLLSRQLAARVQPLAVASRKLAAGDLQARVPDLGDAELDTVASAFNEMATELETSRGRERDFILGVGHDLRTPLTTIGGYAEALESGDFSPEDLERIGSVLGVQTRQLGRLIEDLTTLARLQQAEFSLRSEEVDVGAHVSEVVEGFRRRAEEVGVGLTVEAEDGLTMNVDPDRLAQIAQNLVENALRFTPEPGTINVKVGSVEGEVAIVVTDSGVGISEEDLPHVFDRHFTGRQRRVRNEGSGLGLSIVEGLVGRMGGEVSAASKPGSGTTITVAFPR